MCEVAPDAIASCWGAVSTFLSSLRKIVCAIPSEICNEIGTLGEEGCDAACSCLEGVPSCLGTVCIITLEALSELGK